jgi:NTE family protein
MGGVRWDIPGRVPMALHASFYLNRWDYYKSLATFFEDVKPSYVLLNERYGELSLSTPAGNKGIFRADFIYTHQFDEYYQTTVFVSGYCGSQRVQCSHHPLGMGAQYTQSKTIR